MVVITGAAGFIGSRLAQTLRLKNPTMDLLLVDHPIVKWKSKNIGALEAAKFVNHTDFINSFEEGKIMPNMVYHLGACSDTTEKDWNYLQKNNVLYSQRIWNCCAMTGSPLIYASSAATYGDGVHGFDDEVPINILKPLNLYGQSKHDFDLWVQERVTSFGPKPIQSVGFKFFNVFGPGENHKGRMASMVFHGFHQVKATGKIRLFASHRNEIADGCQLRDFVYVDDVVDIIIKTSAKREINGLFNLGTGKARSFQDLAKAIFNALNRPPKIEYVPMPEDLRGKYQYYTQATMRKLVTAGIDHKFITLDSAVLDYVSNHLIRKNQDDITRFQE